VATAFGALAMLAGRADLVVLGLSLPATTTDLMVGLAFAAAAALSPVPTLQRLLAASVGAAWLAASLLPVRPLHQALLVALLACFPAGRPSGRLGWLALASAVPLAFGWLGQPGAATAVLLAGLAGSRPGSSRAGRWFPPVSGLGVAAVLLASWLLSGRTPDVFDARLSLLAYEAALAGVAVGHLLAARAVAAAGARRVESALARAIALTETGHLAALAPLLADALRDPGLRVYPWAADRAAFVGPDGSTVSPAGPGQLSVTDGAAPVALVQSRRDALADPATRDAVRTAVRLAATQQRLQAEQERELAELQAARRRLIEATDRQHESVATRLRHEVLPALDAALDRLPPATTAAGTAPVDDPLTVVRAELVAASTEVLGLVEGIPPEPLGDGRLAAALRTLADRSLTPVSVQVAPDARADTVTETAAYYVCAEAVTNAVKHAQASAIQVAVTRSHGELALTVRDDGCGGADTSGSGLRGLADRVAAADGQLAVVSPPGGGTTVSAWLPVSRSAARA